MVLSDAGRARGSILSRGDAAAASRAGGTCSCPTISAEDDGGLRVLTRILAMMRIIRIRATVGRAFWAWNQSNEGRRDDGQEHRGCS